MRRVQVTSPPSPRSIADRWRGRTSAAGGQGDEARKRGSQGEPPDERSVALLDAYLDDLRLTRNLSPFTLRNYRADIAAFFRWLAQAKLSPFAADRNDLRRYLGGLGEA